MPAFKNLPLPVPIDPRVFRFLLQRAKSVVVQQSDVHTARRRMEAIARLSPMPSGVTVQPEVEGALPGEWIRPDGADEKRVILYIHGGAFVLCSPATHRSLVAHLAQASRCLAFSLDYRLAPEHPFPAPLEDCLAAYRWLLARGYSPRSIVVSGDSAGGNLTLALLIALRDAGLPLPAGAVCLSPVTDMTYTSGSRISRIQVDPIFGNLSNPEKLVEPYWQGHDPRNPLISPMHADLRGLPPLLFHVGDDEILLDDSVLLAERAREAGVDARVAIWPGMWHVFQAFFMFVPEAQESIEQIGEFVQAISA